MFVYVRSPTLLMATASQWAMPPDILMMGIDSSVVRGVVPNAKVLSVPEIFGRGPAGTKSVSGGV